MIRINEVCVPVVFVDNFEEHKKIISAQLKINSSEIKNIKILKRSIDARNKKNIHFKFNFSILLNEKTETEIINKGLAFKYVEAPKLSVPKIDKQLKTLVVGAGPSGLFSALTLARAGVKVILIEQGEPVEKRVETVNKLIKNGEFNPFSNIQFGEGGAGTFSDGKLNTGINSPLVDEVLNEFVLCGAPKEILYDSKPHIGTDKLRKVVVNLREKIKAFGGEVYFSAKFLDYEERNNKKCARVIIDNKEEIFEVDNIVFALGYSARDTLRHLYSKGLEFKQKAFSVGYRIEHLQEDINKAQYGEFSSSKFLPPADYKLFTHLSNGRTVYTFCMCPGGVVVPAISKEKEIVTNGMSYYSRDGVNSNSAILVSVDERDYNSKHPLAGLDFQEDLERRAFDIGKGKFICSRVEDFLQNKPTKKLGNVVPTIKPEYNLGEVSKLLPKELTESIKEGIINFGKKLKGFDNPDAVLTGIETRSSAPFMIARDQNLQTNLNGVYAIGEGAGMAGGIVSSAVDGIKIALKIIDGK